MCARLIRGQLARLIPMYARAMLVTLRVSVVIIVLIKYRYECSVRRALFCIIYKGLVRGAACTRSRHLSFSYIKIVIFSYAHQILIKHFPMYTALILEKKNQRHYEVWMREQRLMAETARFLYSPRLIFRLGGAHLSCRVYASPLPCAAD